MTGDRVAEMRERLEPVARFAPYKVYVDRVIQSANHPEIRPFVLASNVAPAAAEFIANAPADLAYLLAENARLRAQLDTVREVADRMGAVPDFTATDYDRGRVDQRHMNAEEIHAALNQGGETNGK